MRAFNRTAILAAALALSAAATNGQERVIEQGKTFGDLNGAEGQVTLLRLDVPGGVDGMAIETWGGQGNLDLFVRHGKAPDGKHFDYQSASPTNTERASIPNPQEGAWYVGLYARAAFAGASVRVTFQGVSGPPIPMPVAPEPVAGPLVQTQPAPVLSPPTSQPAVPEPALGPPSPRMPSGPLPLVTPPPPVVVA
ncbi:MAG: pre-peptidase C-terminal domain-containing protein, partial [Planctomycetota bacterium]|nr:pre-peptidase C-terminal domain-containing protein [Planctomycetota bacterium]